MIGLFYTFGGNEFTRKNTSAINIQVHEVIDMPLIASIIRLREFLENIKLCFLWHVILTSFTEPLGSLFTAIKSMLRIFCNNVNSSVTWCTIPISLYVYSVVYMRALTYLFV